MIGGVKWTAGPLLILCFIILAIVTFISCPAAQKHHQIESASSSSSSSPARQIHPIKTPEASAAPSTSANCDKSMIVPTPPIVTKEHQDALLRSNYPSNNNTTTTTRSVQNLTSTHRQKTQPPISHYQQQPQPPVSIHATTNNQKQPHFASNRPISYPVVANQYHSDWRQIPQQFRPVSQRTVITDRMLMNDVDSGGNYSEKYVWNPNTVDIRGPLSHYYHKQQSIIHINHSKHKFQPPASVQQQHTQTHQRPPSHHPQPSFHLHGQGNGNLIRIAITEKDRGGPGRQTRKLGQSQEQNLDEILNISRVRNMNYSASYYKSKAQRTAQKRTEAKQMREPTELAAVPPPAPRYSRGNLQKHETIQKIDKLELNDRIEELSESEI